MVLVVTSEAVSRIHGAYRRLLELRKLSVPVPVIFFPRVSGLNGRSARTRSTRTRLHCTHSTEKHLRRILDLIVLGELLDMLSHHLVRIPRPNPLHSTVLAQPQSNAHSIHSPNPRLELSYLRPQLIK